MMPGRALVSTVASLLCVLLLASGASAQGDAGW